MLRIAVQSKGRLFEDTMALFTEADIKLSTSKRTLLTQSTNFPVEVLFLRDDDIPQCVANGVADLGIVGENEFVERAEEAEIVHRLGFSKCRLSLAIHKETEYDGLQWFNHKKIATSYPHILKNFLNEQQIEADIHVITGSVEISPAIGLADAIFDIVSSGSTLISNNLKEVEVVMKSEALLIGNKNLSAEKKGNPSGAVVPYRRREDSRRQEVCADERAYRQGEGHRGGTAGHQESHHHAAGHGGMEQHPHRHRPETFLGNHRQTEGHRGTGYPGTPHRENDTLTVESFHTKCYYEHHYLS